MTEPTSLSHRCDQCAHVDYTPGVHPMRCSHPDLMRTLPVGVMRSDGSACGPGAGLWEPSCKYKREHAQ